MKKTYISPDIEIFEVEPTGAILQGSLNMSDDRTDGDFGELSNKRQPSSSPWSNSAPWE